MTAPTPPTDPFDALVGVGHKIRDAADRDIKRLHLTYHSVGVILAVLLAFASFEAWKWHIVKLARLEAAASVERVRAAKELTTAEAWRAIAIRRVDSVRVDTVRIARIVYRTPTFTAPIPVTHDDGTSSIVPMPVVLRADFDSLGGTCNRLARDCASALAAKDSASAHDSLVIASLYELNHNTEQRLKMADRAKFFAKVFYGAAGASAGFAAGRASCPR